MNSLLEKGMVTKPDKIRNTTIALFKHSDPNMTTSVFVEPGYMTQRETCQATATMVAVFLRKKSPARQLRHRTMCLRETSYPIP